MTNTHWCSNGRRGEQSVTRKRWKIEMTNTKWISVSLEMNHCLPVASWVSGKTLCLKRWGLYGSNWWIWDIKRKDSFIIVIHLPLMMGKIWGRREERVITLIFSRWLSWRWVNRRCSCPPFLFFVFLPSQDSHHQPSFLIVNTMSTIWREKSIQVDAGRKNDNDERSLWHKSLITRFLLPVITKIEEIQPS